MLFILKPHKSLDKICEEYNVEFYDDDYTRVARAVLDVGNEEEAKRRLDVELKRIGRRHGLNGERLEKFKEDAKRTILFYVKSVFTIKAIIGD